MSKELNDLKQGIYINGRCITYLLYADDTVLVAESEAKLQTLLEIVGRWCKKWVLIVIRDKTKVVHFRKAGQKQTNFVFKINEENVSFADCYKYLGFQLSLSFELH